MEAIIYDMCHKYQNYSYLNYHCYVLIYIHTLNLFTLFLTYLNTYIHLFFYVGVTWKKQIVLTALQSLLWINLFNYKMCLVGWPTHCLTYTYLILTGQSLDNNLQLCWELFLDSLLFHSSWCILYLSIMENEQCKPKTYELSLRETHTLYWISLFGGGRYRTQHSCSHMFASCFIMFHQTWHCDDYGILLLICQKNFNGLLKLHGFLLLLILLHTWRQWLFPMYVVIKHSAGLFYFIFTIFV